MADETDVNENDEQAAGGDAAAAAVDAPAPAEDAAPEAAASGGAASAAGDDAEPEAPLSPKEARRRKRSTHDGTTRPQRSVEERVQERAEARKRKAGHRRAYRAKQRERRAAAAATTPATPPVQADPAGTGRAKTRQGIVVSDKADKTITVRIDMARRHRTYKKIVRTSTTLHAHDEANDAHVGDTVRLVESRPMSRTKRWRLVEILERAR